MRRRRWAESIALIVALTHEDAANGVSREAVGIAFFIQGNQPGNFNLSPGGILLSEFLGTKKETHIALLGLLLVVGSSGALTASIYFQA
jgi:hypothetical protein